MLKLSGVFSTLEAVVAFDSLSNSAADKTDSSLRRYYASGSELKVASFYLKSLNSLNGTPYTFKLLSGCMLANLSFITSNRSSLSSIKSLRSLELTKHNTNSLDYRDLMMHEISLNTCLALTFLPPVNK